MKTKKFITLLTVMILIVCINCIEVKALEHNEVTNVIEENFDLKGLVSIDISHSVNSRFIKKNKEFTIDAIITNNSGYDLENLEFKIFVNGSEEIYSHNIDLIEAKSSKRITTNTAIDNRGLYDIISKVSMNVNDNIVEYCSKSLNISVYNDKSIRMVVIDTNKSINKFINMLEQNNIEVKINSEEINKTVLEGASILVLTEPKSKIYSNEELVAIRDFVNAGGNIIITSKAYKDNNSSELQGNYILKAIGSNIRFNNDKVVDDEINGGEINSLFFNKYNLNSSLLDGINTANDFRFCNGASLNIFQGSNIINLIGGHDTTYSITNNSEENNILVGKGDVVAVAIETLQNGSKILASGTKFFSDDDFNNSLYSNYDIANNIINSLAPKKELEILDISKVRSDSNEDKIADLYGETVVIEGYVTVGTGMFRNIVYIQDKTAGIAIRGMNNISVENGQKIKVKGIVSTERNNMELLVYNDVDNIEIIESDISSIEPNKLFINEIINSINAGTLVKVTGTVKDVNDESIIVYDESGEGIIFLNDYIGKASEVVKVGEKYSFIGIIENNKDNTYIRITKLNDIEQINDNIIDGEEEESVEVKPEMEEEDKSESGEVETDINNSNNNNNEKQENIEKNEEKLPMTGDVASLGCLLILLIIVGGNIFVLFNKYGEN